MKGENDFKALEQIRRNGDKNQATSSRSRMAEDLPYLYNYKIYQYIKVGKLHDIKIMIL